MTNNDWFPLTETPPDELVEVIDADGNIAFAYPTYCPFTVEKMAGDERKPWGWRGTPIPCENHWDGGWMISVGMGSLNKMGTVVGWRNINKKE